MVEPRSDVRRRNREIYLRRTVDGATLAEIGDEFGLTRQRVDQIIEAEDRRRVDEHQLELARRDRRQRAAIDLGRALAEHRALVSRIRSLTAEIRALDEELSASTVDRLLGLAG